MQKTPSKQSPRRRSAPAPPPEPPSPPPEKPSLLRAFLDALRRSGPNEPVRSATELVLRFAFWIVCLGGLIAITIGSDGLTVMEKLLDLLPLLLLVGVIDLWGVLPLLRSLRRFARWVARRGWRD